MISADLIGCSTGLSEPKEHPAWPARGAVLNALRYHLVDPILLVEFCARDEVPSDGRFFWQACALRGKKDPAL